MWAWLRGLLSKKPKLGIDYRVIEEYSARNPIEILKGKYKGVKYYYGDMSLPSEENLTLQFEFLIKENPNDVVLDSAFNKLMGDILVDLLYKNLKETG